MTYQQPVQRIITPFFIRKNEVQRIKKHYNITS